MRCRLGKGCGFDDGSSCEMVVEDRFAISFENGFGRHFESPEVSRLSRCVSDVLINLTDF